MNRAPQQALATLLTVRIHFEAVEKKKFWRQARCKLLTASGCIFHPFYTLLDFLPLSAIAVFSVDDFQWGRKYRPSDSLNSLHTLCPCHLIDRCTLSPFSPPLSPAPNKAIHLLPLSLLGAEWWVFEISAGYLVPNELGGLQWLQEHLPSLSEHT